MRKISYNFTGHLERMLEINSGSLWIDEKNGTFHIKGERKTQFLLEVFLAATTVEDELLEKAEEVVRTWFEVTEVNEDMTYEVEGTLEPAVTGPNGEALYVDKERKLYYFDMSTRDAINMYKHVEADASKGKEGAIIVLHLIDNWNELKDSEVSIEDDNAE